MHFFPRQVIAGTISVLSFALHPKCLYFQFTSAGVTALLTSAQVCTCCLTWALLVTLSLSKPSNSDVKLCMPLHLWSTHCVPDTEEMESPGEMEKAGLGPAFK